MKYFVIFTIVLGITCPKVLAGPESKDQLNPTKTTASTYALGKVFGPVGALLTSTVIKATNTGVKKYQETHDITQAGKVAMDYGVSSVSKLFASATKAKGAGENVVREIQSGADPKVVLAQRTKEAINYLMDEVKREPNGKVAKALITGGNVALTWTMGPLVGWTSAVVAKAAADGLENYNQSGDLTQATQAATKSGYDSAAYLVNAVRGIVQSGVGLAKDISDGKDTRSSLKHRGSQALNSIKGK